MSVTPSPTYVEGQGGRTIFGSRYAFALARMEVQTREFFRRFMEGHDTDKAQDLAKGEVRVGSLEWALFLAAVDFACRGEF